MNKKIAVVVSGRQDEALRMSIGLTLADDAVDVFFVDRKLSKNKDNLLNLETGKELGIHVYSNCENNENVEYLSMGELANKLITYDHVLPY